MPLRREDHPPSWRLPAVVSEGIRNAAHGGGRSLFLAGLLAVVAATAVIAEASVLQGLRDDELRLWQAGSHVVVATAEGGVDGAACEGLSSSVAVAGSGAARRSRGAGRLSNLGSAEITLTEATVGLLAISSSLYPERSTLASSSVVLSQPAAESLGVADGETLVVGTQGLAGTKVAVDAVADLTYMTNRYSTGLITVTPPIEPFDSCLLLAAPGYLTTVQHDLAPLSILPTSGSDASVRLLVDSEQGIAQLLRQADSRVTRWGGLVAGLICGTIWTLTLMLRRPQSGLYRTLGMSYSEVTILRLSEIISLAGVGFGVAVIGSGTFGLLLQIHGDLLTQAFMSVGTTLFLTFLATVLFASPLSWTGDTIHLVKDR